MKRFFDTPSELLEGFLFGLVSCLSIGFYGVLIGILCSILWRFGGIGWFGTNLWRRIGIPLVLCTAFALSKHSWIPIISFPLMWASLSIGYGTPSTQPPDEGSWLGRRFGKWTRCVWWLILMISLIPLFL